MALYENKVPLKGYVGKDAQTFATKQGRAFVVLSLATKSGYKDKPSKQWTIHTEWHRVVAFAKPADLAKKLKRGDYVEIEGKLRSTEFDKEIGGSKKKTSTKQRSWEVRVSIVRKLAQSGNSREKDFDSEPITEEDAA